MANFNKCYFIGRLTADPVRKSFVDGKDITLFSIAVERKVDKENTATTFLDCKAFGNIATAIINYGAKGRHIFIESHAEQQAWTDTQTGKTRTKTTFIIESFQLLDHKPRTHATQSPTPGSQPSIPQEDIPF
jgi:single-strand DNA-binding protein